jgi:transcriptional regulator with XRE-family HTH domain
MAAEEGDVPRLTCFFHTDKMAGMSKSKLSFGQAVKARRIERMLSGSELARRAGLLPAQLWRIAAGSYEPRLDDALAIAAALGTTVDELSTSVDATVAKSRAARRKKRQPNA